MMHLHIPDQTTVSKISPLLLFLISPLLPVIIAQLKERRAKK